MSLLRKQGESYRKILSSNLKILIVGTESQDLKIFGTCISNLLTLHEYKSFIYGAHMTPVENTSVSKTYLDSVEK